MMIKQKKAMQMALEALDQYTAKELTFGQRYTNEGQKLLDAIEALREALAQPEPEPVAWMFEHYTQFFYDYSWHEEVQFVRPPDDPESFRRITPLYTEPPQRNPLTNEQIKLIVLESLGYITLPSSDDLTFTRAIEAAHGIAGISK